MTLEQAGIITVLALIVVGKVIFDAAAGAQRIPTSAKANGRPKAKGSIFPAQALREPVPVEIEEGEIAVNPLDILIDYKDSSGTLTKDRPVTVHGIALYDLWETRARAHSFTAYCSLRKAPRSFRVDRLKRLVDASTGEVIKHRSYWLGAYAKAHNASQ